MKWFFRRVQTNIVLKKNGIPYVIERSNPKLKL